MLYERHPVFVRRRADVSPVSVVVRVAVDRYADAESDDEQGDEGGAP